MKKNIDTINALITAYESRNELLHEEITKNEKAIKELKTELEIIQKSKDIEYIEEVQLKMAI